MIRFIKSINESSNASVQDVKDYFNDLTGEEQQGVSSKDIDILVDSMQELGYSCDIQEETDSYKFIFHNDTNREHKLYITIHNEENSPSINYGVHKNIDEKSYTRDRERSYSDNYIIKRLENEVEKDYELYKNDIEMVKNINPVIEWLSNYVDYVKKHKDEEKYSHLKQIYIEAGI